LGALALSAERQSAQMSEIKNGGLNQYGAEPFEQQQFGTAGIEGVKEMCGFLQMQMQIGRCGRQNVSAHCRLNHIISTFIYTSTDHNDHY